MEMSDWSSTCALPISTCNTHLSYRVQLSKKVDVASRYVTLDGGGFNGVGGLGICPNCGWGSSCMWGEEEEGVMFSGLYFLMPHRFLQECIHSAGFHRIPPESTGFLWNGTRIQWNEPGFHWIVTDGTCISACTSKCVYINRLCSLSVSLSLSGYPLPFLGQISHDTMIVALSLTFLTILKSSYLVLFSWGKMQKG